MCANSMTGFGRGEAKGNQYQLVSEVKSVNHRFKDFRFKMPSLLISSELDLRDMISTQFTRGSFEVYINLKKNQESQASFDLDKNKIESLLELIKTMADKKKVPVSVSPVDFLRNEFFSEDEDQKKQEIAGLLKTSFGEALANLQESRRSEGAKLVGIIQKHIERFEENFQVVPLNLAGYQKEVKEKLEKKMESLFPNLEVEQGRLRQEIVYYLDKLDVEEEINRIRIHLEKLKQILRQTEEIGRNIDFLVQELNRETNTIGSKSGNPAISNAVVQMKVQLEKIREQALNLE